MGLRMKYLGMLHKDTHGRRDESHSASNDVSGDRGILGE